MLKRHLQHRKENLLSYRLLVYILLCSTVLAVLSTAIQLFWDYKKDLTDIQQGMDSIEAGYLDSLSSSLWKLDQDQIEIQLDGIMKLPDIGFVAITEIVAGEPDSVFYRGDINANLPIQRDFKLYYRDTLVGLLSVGATLDNVYQRLLQKFFIILASQAIKTLLVSICILVIVHYMIVTHLNRLARFARDLDLDNIDKGVELEPSRLRREGSDAIDQLADTLNLMRNNISKQLRQKKKAQLSLERLNEELEQRVNYRTATLKHTNDRLSGALKELTHTKDRLVETEKMAALGALVSGIADEIEKPVNGGLQISAQIHNELSAADAENIPLISQASQHNDQIHTHLEQMAALIKAFRLIAIDPRTLSQQLIELPRLVEQVEHTFAAPLARLQINVELQCDPRLEISSYANLWRQLFSQLIQNSLQHGFAGQSPAGRDREIRINIERRAEQLHLTYSDNGQGIPEQILPRVFEPFVATRSEHGGSGLGTHVVYRLVTHLLRGSISCHSRRGQGVEFRIQIPLNSAQHSDADDGNLW